MEQLCLPPQEVSRQLREGAPDALRIPTALPQIPWLGPRVVPAVLPVAVTLLNVGVPSSGPRRAPRPIPPPPTLDHKNCHASVTPEGHRYNPRAALVMKRSKCREIGLRESTSRQLYSSLS